MKLSSQWLTPITRAHLFAGFVHLTLSLSASVEAKFLLVYDNDIYSIKPKPYISCFFLILLQTLIINMYL